MPITINGSGTITGASTLATTVVSPTLTTPIATTTIGVGNTTPSASGSGITFPATQSASTDANTLDDYEEGTWTPSVTSGSGSITTVGAVSGVYTKIGNVLVVEFTITITTNGTGAGSILASGLPFAATANAYVGCGRENAATGNLLQLYLPSTSNTVTVKNYNDTYPAGNGYTMFGTISYRTS